MTPHCRPRALSVLVVAGAVALLASVTPDVRAQAAASTQPPAKPAQSVRFIKAPSDETPAARAKRLKRECKGRPNAGACLGHTR